MIYNGRVVSFILLSFTFAAVFIMIRLAKQGKQIHIKTISGLEAIPELIRRAEELDGIVHFTTGGGSAALGTVLTPMLLSGVAMLGVVASECAKLGTKLVIHEAHADLLPVIEATVERAYLLHNKPVPPDVIRYIPSGFSFTSGVGSFLKYGGVAANVMAGTFYHEAVFLSELGAEGGAMQIGGTARIWQCPYFAAACDYVLIGEELYAADAYIYRGPEGLGSQRGTDFAKVLSLILTILGVITMTLGSNWLLEILKI